MAGAFAATGSLGSFARFHRLPFKPACGFQSTPGTNKIEPMLLPLIVAMPHSVSTVTSLTSVAPVIESPLSMTTVVEASSAEANLIPATSVKGMLATPNEVCMSNWVVSVNVPWITVLLIKSTLTLSGRALLETTALATGVALATTSAFLAGAALASSSATKFRPRADEEIAATAKQATRFFSEKGNDILRETPKWKWVKRSICDR